MSIIQERKEALGSEIILTLRPPAGKCVGSDLFRLLWRKIDQFEQRFSRFLPKSELSEVNKKASSWIKISPEFMKLVLLCQEMSAKTNGLFNPFVLPKLQFAGYLGSWPDISKVASDLDYSKRSSCSFSKIKIIEDQIKIPANCALDFGGIGKGFLLDKIAKIIEAEGIKDYWLSFGGDMICSGNGEARSGWQIGVASATEIGKTADTIETRGKRVAIATSGIIKRRGEKNGRNWHHIIDPRTKAPAESDVSTATVVAKSAVLADVYAKCLVMLGSKEAMAFLEKREALKAILQRRNDTKSLTFKSNKNGF